MKYVYAALLLHKLGKEVSEENVKKVVAATGEDVDESKVKSLTASLKGVDIAKELENASLAVSAPAGGSAEGGAEESKGKEGAEKKEEKKEEKSEAAADGLGALFG